MIKQKLGSESSFFFFLILFVKEGVNHGAHRNDFPSLRNKAHNMT